MNSMCSRKIHTPVADHQISEQFATFAPTPCYTHSWGNEVAVCDGTSTLQTNTLFVPPRPAKYPL